MDDPAEPSDDDAAPPYVVTPDGAWATADRLRCSHAAFTADATRLVELSFVFSGVAAAGEQRVTALREAFLASDAWRVEPAIRKLKARHGAEGTLLLVECDALAGLSADPSGPALAADAPRHKGKKRGGKRKLPAGK